MNKDDELEKYAEAFRQKNTYKLDNSRFYKVSKKDVDLIKMNNEHYFDNPELLLNCWIESYFMNGSALLNIAKNHFKTLSDPDMPQGYIEEFINEFDARIEEKLFIMKEKRFKLIRSNDNLSKAFNKEVTSRNESYFVAEDILTNLGYNKKEITTALSEVVKEVSNIADTQEIINKALKSLSGN